MCSTNYLHKRRFEDAERAQQVATLISGAEITEATLESARELMATGRSEKD